MFKYFKFTKESRKSSEEPKDVTTWIKHGVAEFIGTIVLTMFLAGLSTVITSDGKTIESFFIHPILVGFYSGFIVIGTILIIFLRWSCDLNPAVTIYRMINGTNKIKYGFFKLAIQFVAGVIAGLIIYGIGNSISGDGVANHAIDAWKADGKSFLVSTLKDKQSVASGGTWIFFIEMVMTTVLLFPIFSPNINDKYRDLLIMFIISLAVFMGILGGTAAINPARGLGQQVPGLFFGHHAGQANSANSLIVATITMMLGGIAAPFFYALMQGFGEKYFNPWFVKAISFKNNRSNNMKNDGMN